MDLLKLHVEVHGNKFDGEGPAAIITKAYQDFLAKVGQVPAAAVEKPTPIFKDNPPPGALDALYKRVYVEKDGVISLLAQPKTEDLEGDALLLLMYGYQQLKPAEYPVTAVRLMQSAKQSGLNIERIDRVIVGISGLVMKTGFKRSTRYSLNNPGHKHALEVMHKMFG